MQSPNAPPGRIAVTVLGRYPHEREILFGPLTGIEVLNTRVDGSVVVIVVVLFLMGFMAAADYLLGNVFTRIITGGGA